MEVLDGGGVVFEVVLVRDDGVVGRVGVFVFVKFCVLNEGFDVFLGVFVWGWGVGVGFEFFFYCFVVDGVEFFDCVV